jgi:protein-disulfide isomerase
MLRRQFCVSAAGALLFAGCNRGGSSAADGPGADDMTLGARDARVHLIEYASSTCPVCRMFHDNVWPQLRSNYIDTGKVRFTLREYPAHEPALAVAGFQVARCGGVDAERYFERLDTLFAQQDSILGAGSIEAARQRLIEIGGGFGLSEQQVIGCIESEEGAARARRMVESARQYNIPGTPTLILNDRMLTDPSVLTYSGLAHEIDAALGG